MKTHLLILALASILTGESIFAASVKLPISSGRIILQTNSGDQVYADPMMGLNSGTDSFIPLKVDSSGTLMVSGTGGSGGTVDQGNAGNIGQEWFVKDATARTTLSSILGKLDVNLSTVASQATLSLLNGKVTAVDTGNVTVISSALPSGAATAANQATANTSLSNIDTSTAVKPVLQFLDTNPVLNVASTNIPASGSSALTVVASLGQNIKRITVADTTGQWINVYEGSTLRCVINPGMDRDKDCPMSSGSAVKIRASFNAAITAGELMVEFR